MKHLSKMVTPSDWDDKSWSDVNQVESLLLTEMEHIRQLLTAPDPDAQRIRDAFANVERLGAVGSFAANWCTQ